MLIKNKDELKKSFLSVNGNVYIVGAGKYGDIIGKWLIREKISWIGYIDSRREGDLNGKEIIKTLSVESYYLISSYVYKHELENNLIEQGIDIEKIWNLESNELFFDIYSDLLEWKPYVKRNQKFKDCHKNKRCFIVGNGPSLRVEDLEKIKNEITFGCNSIYALYDQTNWRPTYYCAWDPVFCSVMMQSKEEVKRIMEGCVAAFTSVLGDGIQFKDEKDLSNLYYVNGESRLDEETGLPFFSCDCSETVYGSGSIAYAMLQLAVYMGFREIYLLGMDCSFSVEKVSDSIIENKECQNHMMEIEDDERIKDLLFQRYGYCCHAEMDLIFEGYKSAKNYCDMNGIKIYNATRGGKLEIFERVDFDSLF